MTIDPEEYDCVRCGACCISDFDAIDYVQVTEEDRAPLTEEEQDFYIHVEDDYGKPCTSMKTAYDSRGNCRCKALEGVVGRRVSCGIYDRRPSVCRKFEPGTDVCDYARRLAFGVSEK